MSGNQGNSEQAEGYSFYQIVKIRWQTVTSPTSMSGTVQLVFLNGRKEAEDAFLDGHHQHFEPSHEITPSH